MPQSILKLVAIPSNCTIILTIRIGGVLFKDYEIVPITKRIINTSMKMLKIAPKNILLTQGISMYLHS